MDHPHHPTSSKVSSSSAEEINYPHDDDGWEDVEQDPADLQHIVCFFDEQVFPNLLAMLAHCKEAHNFDFVSKRDEIVTSFYGNIKLVNYLRQQTKAGKPVPHNVTRNDIEPDEFLTPVLEADEVLFNLDDIDEGKEQETHINGEQRIKQLEDELQRTQSQFMEYKLAVKKNFDERMKTDEAGLPQQVLQDDDSHYFDSYAYNDIHETMLKDSVRTDAYRDFVYENKHLFRDKVVLDVGCGTGILSMFCAKAGAKKVIAVDNSDIFIKALENVFLNGLQDVIKCCHGKIEDLDLQVEKVDIIISEWMGYCLLYESMLDSVLWARDRYLTPDGLSRPTALQPKPKILTQKSVIPSHMTLHVAAFADPEYIASHIHYWNSVYGFVMTSMLDGIYSNVKVLLIEPSKLASESEPILQLPLHTVSSKELDFSNPFSITLNKDIDALDGFVVWFDTFFTSSRKDLNPQNTRAENWPKGAPHGIAFTTGPHGTATHWSQGILLIDHGKTGPEPLKAGTQIEGQMSYKKTEENSREVEISVAWKYNGAEQKSQKWFVR
ncbi:MAG: hypothetical protein M1829_002638 [Trizodia sp. TS-e1964]|nr:MAG: hypothetical protein M1829_002638 [Trizodia sp. TS-e1964]